MTTPLNETATVQDLFFDGVPGRPVDALTQLMRERARSSAFSRLDSQTSPDANSPTRQPESCR